jgi:hypothetical protein
MEAKSSLRYVVLNERRTVGSSETVSKTFILQRRSARLSSGLFIGTVSSSDCIVSSDRLLVNNEFDGTWKKAVVA